MVKSACTLCLATQTQHKESQSLLNCLGSRNTGHSWQPDKEHGKEDRAAFSAVIFPPLSPELLPRHSLASQFWTTCLSLNLPFAFLSLLLLILLSFLEDFSDLQTQERRQSQARSKGQSMRHRAGLHGKPCNPHIPQTTIHVASEDSGLVHWEKYGL